MVSTTPKPRDSHESDQASGEYEVRLSAFQGPLDLLLFLIRRAEVDIHDVPIAEITEQYLSFVRRDVAQIDMEQAGEFLVMAATLIEIKARTLAPKLPRGREGEGGASEAALDPRGELIQALLSFQRYRRAAEELEAHRRLFWKRHAVRIDAPASLSPGPEESADDPERRPFLELDDVHVLDLSESYERIAGAIDFTRLGDHRIEYDDTPIALHQEDLLDRLGRAGTGRLALQSIFEGRSRLEMIGLFLAALELARQRRIVISDGVDVEVALNTEPASASER